MEKDLSRRNLLRMAGIAFSSSAVASFTSMNLSDEKASVRSGALSHGMRIGSDTDKLYSVNDKGAIAVLDYLKANGFEGAFFRLMLDLSPTLDESQLKEIKAHANSLGLFLDSGIGWVNPYNTAERPEIRRFGNGDYRLAMEKMIKAARLIDCTELWAVSAHSVHGDPFYVAYDRFRTDVPWGDQLTAMKKFINSLAPLLRDLGLRINLETHGDETSFELVRLIEEIGPDVVGVTLDTGNLPLQADVPMDAIRRLAPYVHLTHCKDGILYRTAEGLVQQLRSVGEGIVDWEAALEALGKYSPDLHLCFEDYRAENLLKFYDSRWRVHFPELTEADVREFERLAKNCEGQIARGEIPGAEEYKKLPFGDAERLQSYQKGAAHLKKILKTKGLG